MKHKKIIALLTAVAIMGAFAGCKANNKPGQGNPPEDFNPPSFETEAPIQSNAQQAVGKVTAIDGTKITVELGELKSRTPGNGGSGNGSRRERPDGDNGNGNGKSRKNGGNKERPSDWTRPSGDGNGSNRPSGFGYSFNATGGNATYDLSGLTQITIENDSDDTPDTVDEIKTGDVIVVEVDKDGKVTSLTVKSLGGGFGGRSGSGGNGKRTVSRDDNGNRKERGDRKSRKGDSEDA